MAIIKKKVEKRIRCPHSICRSLDLLLKKFMRKQDFLFFSISKKWKDIVGEDLSKFIIPYRVAYSKSYGYRLEVSTNYPWLINELKHKEEEFISKITFVVGEKSISHIKYVKYLER